MQIAVIGTGVVGRSVAAALAGQGHQVTVGTRDAAATRSRSEPDAMGTPPFSEWLSEHSDVALAGFSEAAAAAECVVNATGGSASMEALTLAGKDNLAGKVLIDISNPLDFSQGFPPSLFVKDTDSLAEQIQRAFPEARVVKALNTMTAALMSDPGQVADGEHSTFISGDDASAKASVTDLLQSIGHSDVIDLGDITSARGLEMYMPLWLRLYGALGTPMFNIKVVR